METTFENAVSQSTACTQAAATALNLLELSKMPPHAELYVCACTAALMAEPLNVELGKRLRVATTVCKVYIEC